MNRRFSAETKAQVPLHNSFLSQILGELFRGKVPFLFHDSSHRKSGRKKEPKPKLFGPDISSGVGVFHVNGWGPKSSIRPSKPGKFNLLGRDIPGFAGISRGRPKSLRKKSLCSVSVP